MSHHELRIVEGVQLFTDYNQDTNVDVAEYLNNKSLTR